MLPAKVSFEFETALSGTTWSVTSARSGTTHLTGHVRPL